LSRTERNLNKTEKKIKIQQKLIKIIPRNYGSN